SEAGSAPRASRAGPKRSLSQGTSRLAATAPAPQQPKRTASRGSPAGATPRVRSAHGTSIAVQAPLAAACVVPASVRVRTIASPNRNDRPPRMSASSARGAAGRRPGAGPAAGRGSDSGRASARTIAAEASAVSALTEISGAGAAAATTRPTSGGTASSTRLVAPYTAAYPAVSRSLPSSRGSAPKFAASNTT